MARAALRVLALCATLGALAPTSTWASSRTMMPPDGRPLSYVLADTAFLADEIQAIRDEGVDWVSKLSDYFSLVERTVGGVGPPAVEVDDEGQHRFKRELPTDHLATLTTDLSGVFLLDRMVERFNVPAKFPNDVVLFSRVEHNETVWYAAALESDGENPQQSLANSLVVYKLMDTTFLEQTRERTFGASTLAVHEIGGWVYLLAAEKKAILRDAPEKGSVLYRLSLDGRKLVRVMTVEAPHPGDLCFWRFGGVDYLAVATEFTNASGVISFSGETLVYQWYGEHLDIIDRLPTSGARSVTAFNIKGKQYLAVVNHIDDSGDTKIESTIFRFDAVRARFVVHQKLGTYGAVDASFFSMNRGRGMDHFLAVANNFFQGADNVRNENTDSVIYKWSETENFFVPFQSVRLVSATQWTPYMGPRGETLLLAVSAYGLHAFQYDGWRFQELPISGQPNLSGPEASISSLRSLVFGSEGLVVVASKQSAGTLTNVFALGFKRTTPLEYKYAELRYWCEDQLKWIEQHSVDDLARRVEAAPKWTQDVVELDTISFETNSIINSVVAGTVRSHTRVVNSAFVDTVNGLARKVASVERDLAGARSTMEHALKKDGDNVVLDRVVMHNATVKCPAGGACRFGKADVILLNNENAEDLVRNVVRLNDPVNFGQAAPRFSRVVVPGTLVTRRVLGKNTTSLVHRLETKQILGNLVVNELTLDGGLNVDGLLDGTRISPDNVLLVDGDQNLAGYTSISHWQVEKLILNGRANGMTLNMTPSELPREVPTGPPGPTLKLEVNDVTLTGLLGTVDIREVDRRALRRRGNQIVTGAFSFSNLKVTAAVADALPEIRLEDVVRVDMDAVLPVKLIFSEPLHVSAVQVYDRMNHIAVAKDGSMDLLRRVGSAQRVTGHKWVRTLEVTDQARVRGRIIGLVIPTTEEVRVIRDEQIFEGEVTISGKVIVHGDVVATDIQGSGQSIMNVIQNAIPLGAALPSSVVFEKLDVVNLNVNLVNGIPTSQWILDFPEAEVFLNQLVKFDADLVVTDASTVTGKVNGVSLKELSDTTLKTTGDQVILGPKTFHSLSVHAIWSNHTTFGGQQWLDLSSQRDRLPQDKWLENDVRIDGELWVKRVKVDGSLSNSGVDLILALKDSVFSDDGITVIDGPKTFEKTITVEHLDVSANVGGDLNAIAQMSGSAVAPDQREELSFEVPVVHFERPLTVGRLDFHGTLDGMTDADWSEPWMEVDGDQTLLNPQTVVGNVDALSGVQVSTTINKFSLPLFAEQVVKIDAPELHFGTVHFDGTVDARGGVTAATVGGVDLSDALLARGALAQEMSGAVTLSAGLDVRRALVLEGTLAGENFKNICAFANPTLVSLNAPQHLTVIGDVHMEEELVINRDVNGKTMSKLLSNTWMKDRPAKITADMEFEDVMFYQDVTVKDRIDGVNLNAVAARYVSLSSDGTITTDLNVEGGIVVEGKLLSGGSVDVVGKVNDIVLSELPNKVLMDGPDQDVSGRMQFGEVRALGDVVLDGTVNGLDLSKDVVLLSEDARYALAHNTVTERKRIRGSMNVRDLGLEKGVRVQDVDLMAWSQDAVRVSGDHIVTGAKFLNEPQIAGGLMVDGLVAGVRVDANHLMVRNLHQMIEGRKTFRPTPLPGLGLHVAELTVDGLVNDVNMKTLLANQAYKTGDVRVESPVHFRGEGLLRGDSALLEGLYQGVNVSELIYAALNPPLLDQYAAQHEQLLSMAEHVQQSLKAQGYYLNYYHTAADLQSRVRGVFPIGRGSGLFVDPVYAIGVVRESSVFHDLDMNFYAWDSATNTIVPHPILGAVSLPRTLRLIVQAEWSGNNAVYWEADDPSGITYGHLMALRPNGVLGLAQMIADSIPSSWVVFKQLGSTNCFLRGAPGSVLGTNGYCALYCHGLKPGSDDLTRQALDVPQPMHATTLMVQRVPYVFVASGASEVSEGEVSAWRWDGATQQVSLVQRWLVANASALAAVEYRGIAYLATASGHAEDAPHQGLVHITRYDSQAGAFAHWHSLEVEGPRSVEFAVLPSGELVLYVATWCPTSGLVVFQYRGVSGFVRRAAAAVPPTASLSAFTTAQHQHVVAVGGSQSRGGGDAALLQAVFKGSWENSEKAFTGL